MPQLKLAKTAGARKSRDDGGDASQTGATGSRPARSTSPKALPRSAGAKSRALSAGLDAHSEASDASQTVAQTARRQRKSQLSAASCHTKSSQLCRHYTGARCAYGARAADCVPGAPPALDDLKERQLLHAHGVPNATSYDDFEHDPASALLLLAHNTNLGSFPALQRLGDPGLRARPLEFKSVINECKVEIITLVRDILAARLEQLYDARDYRQAQYCTPARHASAVCALNLKRTLRLAVHVGSSRRTP